MVGMFVHPLLTVSGVGGWGPGGGGGEFKQQGFI